VNIRLEDGMTNPFSEDTGKIAKPLGVSRANLWADLEVEDPSNFKLKAAGVHGAGPEAC
jgi:hypothetical protein